MYLSHYNLDTKPFQMSTDPEFLWLGEKHKEALATLKYAILENKGILALTGDVGTGKTTLINALIASLGDDTTAATIYDPSLEVLEFFNVVAAAFYMDKTFSGKGEFIIHFRQFLKKARERNQKVLLIVDEAQRVNADLLEEIRLLSNLEDEHIRLLNIFFVGQNEFVDTLKKYKNRALRQRISIRYHIEPLTLSETEVYTRHRLKIAGAKARIFSSGAIQEIYSFSNGYPRLINSICDHAMLSGYARELIIINEDVIKECREELDISGWISGQDEEAVKERKEEPQISKMIPAPDTGYAEDDESESERDVSVLHTIDKPGNRGLRVGFVVIGIALLAAIGSVAGYDFYKNATNKLKAHPNPPLRQSETSYPEQAGQKNDITTTVQTAPEQEAFNVPAKVEIEKVEESQFFLPSIPEPELLKEATQNKPETLDVTAKVEAGKPEGSSELKVKEPETKSSEEITTKKVKTASVMPPKRVESEPKATLLFNKKPEKIKALISTPSQPSVKPKKSVAVKKDEGKRVEKPKVTQPKADSAKPQITTPLVMAKSFESTSEPVIDSDKDKQQAAGTIATIDSVTEKVGVPAKESEEKKVVRNVEEKVVQASRPEIKPQASIKKTFSYENMQDRLRNFLNNYCQTYEKKELDKLAAFFAPDAIEKGKPFSSRLEQYRRNFEKIDSMDYRIELKKYSIQESTELIRIEGIFYIRAKTTGSKKLRENTGRITMELVTHGDSFLVKQLNY